MTLRAGINVGEISAEDDTIFLNECFVDLPIFGQLLDISGPKSIVLGRTGSGKTAMLNQIEKQKHDSVIRVDPKEIAFQYISNSDIIPFVLDLGCDLNLLFQYLWKHVFVAKSISHYYSRLDLFQNALNRLFDAHNPARQYFEKYANAFWVNQDTVMQEITNSFTGEVSASISGKIGEERWSQLSGGLATKNAITNQEKHEIQKRVREAVNNIQIREMNSAIENLNALMDNKQKNFYIIIDDLDVDWAPSNIQYKLIHSLIDSIKSFRKLRNVKVIASLRSDVYERAISASSGDGSQPEKYDGICVHVKWKAEDLREMLDRRISFMYKRQYTRDHVKFSDLFPEKVRGASAFDYIVDRTLLRPRDLLAFVNLILDKAAGTTHVTPRQIQEVESEYSRKRRDALVYEWRSVHRKIETYIQLLTDQTGKVDVKDLAKRDALLDVCLAISELETKEYFKDDCYQKAMVYLKRENESNLFQFCASVISVLYKIGAIKLKLAKQDFYLSSYVNDAIVNPDQITREASFSVSPMLWRALGITPNLPH